MTTPYRPGSYITIDEYRAAPTGLRTNNLVPNGTQAQQDAELAALIARASRWVDNCANQPLYGSTNRQHDHARVEDGNLVLHAHQDRVRSIVSLAWGAAPQHLAAYTPPDNLWVDNERLLVPLGAAGSTWTGSLTGLSRPTFGKVYVDWTYTAGWVCTVLTADAAAGASTLTVADTAGARPDAVLTLTDGTAAEQVTVASVSGSTLTLAAPLDSAWTTGAGCSEVPDDVREATILVTTHYIKQRKGAGVVMGKASNGGSSAGGSKKTQQEIGVELAQAEPLAAQYMRRYP